MSRRKYFFYWAVILVLAAIILIVLLIAGSSSTQALDSFPVKTLHGMPGMSTPGVQAYSVEGNEALVRSIGITLFCA